VRDLRHRFFDPFVATRYLRRLDGKILFRLLHPQREFGLLRTAAGDQAFHAGIYIRVIMLVSAVLVGLLIVRTHSYGGGRPVDKLRAGSQLSCRAKRDSSSAIAEG
jgi:hypothetical protein